MSSERESILETVRQALSSDPAFQNRWESVIEDLIASNATDDPQSIAQLIRKSGVLDQVVSKIRTGQTQQQQPVKSMMVAKITDLNNRGPENLIIPSSAVSPELDDFLAMDQLPIQFTLRRGANFVDYMSLDSLPQSERPVLQVVFCFGGTRFISDMYLAAPEVTFAPETRFVFTVPLAHKNSGSSLRSLIEYLLNARQPISVYLLEYRQTNESWIPALRMHGAVEWRHCLHSSESNQPIRVELRGVGEVAHQCLGVLELEANIS